MLVDKGFNKLDKIDKKSRYVMCNLSDTVFAVDYSWGVFEGYPY